MAKHWTYVVVLTGTDDTCDVLAVSAHITKRGAAGGVIAVAGSVSDHLEDVFGMPERAVLKDIFEEIEDTGDPGDSRIYTHEWDMGGVDYKIEIFRTELED